MFGLGLAVRGLYDATKTALQRSPTMDVLTVLRVELVRAPLLVLSIMPFVLAYRAPRRRTMAMTGLLLFWVGGVVPLVLQMGMLPWLLLLASAVEIFL